MFSKDHVFKHIQTFSLGAVHKVRHARGGEGRGGVTVCDRGSGGKEHVTSHL